jgi:hypothetical protein
MPELLCERVGPGMREDERTVAIRDIFGRREFLRVPYGFLTHEGDKYYVPVGVVHIDKEKQLVLIELPQEGECGSWRLWVRVSDLLWLNGSPP